MSRTKWVVLAVMGGLALLASPGVQAQSQWDGGSPGDTGDANWSTGENWAGDTAPVSDQDLEIEFGAVALENGMWTATIMDIIPGFIDDGDPGTAQVPMPLVLNKLSFLATEDGTFSIAGGTGTEPDLGSTVDAFLQFQQSTGAVAPTILMESANMQTVTAPIVLADALTLDGSGTGTLLLGGDIDDGGFGIVKDGTFEADFGDNNEDPGTGIRGGVTLNAGTIAISAKFGALGARGGAEGNTLTINGGTIKSVLPGDSVQVRNDTTFNVSEFTFLGDGVTLDNNGGGGLINLTQDITFHINNTVTEFENAPESGTGNSWNVIVDGPGTLHWASQTSTAATDPVALITVGDGTADSGTVVFDDIVDLPATGVTLDGGTMGVDIGGSGSDRVLPVGKTITLTAAGGGMFFDDGNKSGDFGNTNASLILDTADQLVAPDGATLTVDSDGNSNLQNRNLYLNQANATFLGDLAIDDGRVTVANTGALGTMFQAASTQTATVNGGELYFQVELTDPDLTGVTVNGGAMEFAIPDKTLTLNTPWTTPATGEIDVDDTTITTTAVGGIVLPFGNGGSISWGDGSNTRGKLMDNIDIALTSLDADPVFELHHNNKWQSGEVHGNIYETDDIGGDASEDFKVLVTTDAGGAPDRDQHAIWLYGDNTFSGGFEMQTYTRVSAESPTALGDGTIVLHDQARLELKGGSDGIDLSNLTLEQGAWLRFGGATPSAMPATPLSGIIEFGGNVASSGTPLDFSIDEKAVLNATGNNEYYGDIHYVPTDTGTGQTYDLPIENSVGRAWKWRFHGSIDEGADNTVNVVIGGNDFSGHINFMEANDYSGTTYLNTGILEIGGGTLDAAETANRGHDVYEPDALGNNPKVVIDNNLSRLLLGVDLTELPEIELVSDYGVVSVSAGNSFQDSLVTDVLQDSMLFLGASWSSWDYDEATLTPGAGGVYRLGGGGFNDYLALTQENVLTGANKLEVGLPGDYYGGSGNNEFGGSNIRILAANDFTGGTVINSFNWGSNKGENRLMVRALDALGTGDVDVHGPRGILQLHMSGTLPNNDVNLHGGTLYAYGNTSFPFDDAAVKDVIYSKASHLDINAESWDHKLTIASLARGDHGVLLVDPYDGLKSQVDAAADAAANTIIVVTAGLTPVNGILTSIYQLDDEVASFMTVADGTDLVPVDPAAADFTDTFVGADATSYVEITTDTAVGAGEAAYAVRLGANLTGSETLALGDGTTAQLLANGSRTIEPNIDAGTAELIIINDNDTLTTEGSVTAADVVKAGQETWAPQSAANAISGTVYLHEGDIELNDGNDFGGANLTMAAYTWVKLDDKDAEYTFGALNGEQGAYVEFDDDRVKLTVDTDVDCQFDGDFTDKGYSFFTKDGTGRFTFTGNSVVGDDNNNRADGSDKQQIIQGALINNGWWGGQLWVKSAGTVGGTGTFNRTVFLEEAGARWLADVADSTLSSELQTQADATVEVVDGIRFTTENLVMDTENTTLTKLGLGTFNVAGMTAAAGSKLDVQSGAVNLGVVVTDLTVDVQGGATLGTGSSIGTGGAQAVVLFGGSNLAVELTGNDTDGTTQSDKLDVLDELDLSDAQTLILEWMPGADAASKFGGAYTVAEYGTLVDVFEQVGKSGGGEPPLVHESYVDSVAYGSGTDDAIVVTLHDLLDGDATLNGQVGDEDFSVLLGNWGETDQDWFNADFNFNGQVGDEDFALLLGQWGAAAGTGGAAPTPEPATVALMALGVAGLLARRRRP